MKQLELPRLRPRTVTMPLHEQMKDVWGLAYKPVTPEAFLWMRTIVTGQLFGPRGVEMRA